MPINDSLPVSSCSVALLFRQLGETSPHTTFSVATLPKPAGQGLGGSSALPTILLILACVSPGLSSSCSLLRASPPRPFFPFPFPGGQETGSSPQLRCRSPGPLPLHKGRWQLGRAAEHPSQEGFPWGSAYLREPAVPFWEDVELLCCAECRDGVWDPARSGC